MGCKPTYKGKRYNSIEELRATNKLSVLTSTETVKEWEQFLAKQSDKSKVLTTAEQYPKQTSEQHEEIDTINETREKGLDSPLTTSLDGVANKSRVDKHKFGSALKGRSVEEIQNKLDNEIAKANAEIAKMKKAGKTNAEIAKKVGKQMSLDDVLKFAEGNHQENLKAHLDAGFNQIYTAEDLNDRSDSQINTVVNEDVTPTMPEDYQEAMDEYKQSDLGSANEGKAAKAKLVDKAKTKEGKAFVDHEVSKLEKNSDGTITVYRSGSMQDGHNPVTTDKKVAETIAKERKKKGLSSEVTEIRINPEDVSAVVPGVESELLIEVNKNNKERLNKNTQQEALTEKEKTSKKKEIAEEIEKVDSEIKKLKDDKKNKSLPESIEKDYDKHLKDKEAKIANLKWQLEKLNTVVNEDVTPTTKQDEVVEQDEVTETEEEEAPDEEETPPETPTTSIPAEEDENPKTLPEDEAPTEATTEDVEEGTEVEEETPTKATTNKETTEEDTKEPKADKKEQPEGTSIEFPVGTRTKSYVMSDGKWVAVNKDGEQGSKASEERTAEIEEFLEDQRSVLEKAADDIDQKIADTKKKTKKKKKKKSPQKKAVRYPEDKISELTGTIAKNIRDLYNIGKNFFKLTRSQSLGQAVIADRMIGVMAKREGISKAKMYSKLDFRKGDKGTVEELRSKGALFQKAKKEFEIFKSTAAEGIQKIRAPKATVKQWMSMIAKNGGKGTAQELTWIGLEDFLNDYLKEHKGKSIPKEVVEQYIADNKIEVVEVEEGQNYREVSLILPSKGSEPNTLANVRISDKPTENGGRAMFVGEIKFDDTIQKTEGKLIEGNKEVYNKTTQGVRMIIRRLLKMAVDEGFDRVNLSNNITLKIARNEAKRFDKKAKVDSVKVNKKAQLSIAITPAMRMAMTSAIPLFQNAQGAMVAEAGMYAIYALMNPNVTTPLHELTHVFEHYLTDEERQTVSNWVRGLDKFDVNNPTDISEALAVGFEKYLSEGKSPTPELQNIFDRFKQWLLDIYSTITGSDIDLELNDQMRNIYATMLGEGFDDKRKSAATKEASARALMMKDRVQSINTMSQSMFERFGIKTRVVDTQTLEGEIRAKHKDLLLLNSGTLLDTESKKIKDADKIARETYGFFDKVAQEAVIRKDAPIQTTIHAAFSHPFIEAVKKSNPELYANLLIEAQRNEDIVAVVDAAYDQAQRNDEYIKHSIDKYTKEGLDEQKDKGLVAAVKRFFTELSDALKEILDINTEVGDLSADITLKDLAQYTIYGTGKINLQEKQYQKTDKAKNKKASKKIDETPQLTIDELLADTDSFGSAIEKGIIKENKDDC